jgi:hypothetical protein
MFQLICFVRIIIERFRQGVEGRFWLAEGLLHREVVCRSVSTICKNFQKSTFLCFHDKEKVNWNEVYFFNLWILEITRRRNPEITYEMEKNLHLIVEIPMVS